ncbi:MAG: 7-cyano-7-deazaguanine synthase QueC [Chlamydiales bacterium]|nr:7-cyano-7-deazaguanine synthase QueC [Chlamydiales bacterium]
MSTKKAVVLFSGGMDSSICLKLAINKWGAESVLALSFSYQQRHTQELLQAAKIAAKWKVDHEVLQLDVLKKITRSSLIGHTLKIEESDDGLPPNSMVLGRNGLMLRLAAIYGDGMGVEELYTGVMELEEANSGYRDCSRRYIDLKQEILRIDLGRDNFSIQTPLVTNTKKENMYLAKELGILNYLLEETITCYEGIPHHGCGTCPACQLRNEGIEDFLKEQPDFTLPYTVASTP